MIRSLRGRLLLGMIVGIVFLLFMFGVAVYTTIERALTEEFDSSLASAANTLANLVEQRGDRIRLDLSEIEIPELAQEMRPYFFEFWLSDGTLLGRSTSLGKDERLPMFHGPAEKPEFRDLGLPNGRPGRGIGIEFHPKTIVRRVTTSPAADKKPKPATGPDSAAPSGSFTGSGSRIYPFRRPLTTRPAPRPAAERMEEGERAEGAGASRARAATRPAGRTSASRPATSRPVAKGQFVVLVVAQDAGDLAAEMGLLRWLLVCAAAGTILIAVLVAVVVVRQGLRPLHTLAVRIAAIKADDLSRRVPTDRMPTELAPVAQRLNDLLGRLEEAFNRERSFTADVAHELRTPLAGIRSTMEVALSRARKAEDYRESLDDCLAIASRMQSMVSNLLMLARLDAGQVTFRSEPVNLPDLVESCWMPLADKAAARQIGFDNRMSSALACHCDGQNLSLVVSNLLENAAEYTDTGGRVWITGEALDGTVEVCVSNTGCKLTAEDLPNVFRRLWRGDASRSDTGLHFGLGLALVRRIVTALSGTVEATVEEGGVFAIRLVLPAATEATT